MTYNTLLTVSIEIMFKLRLDSKYVITAYLSLFLF